MNSTENKNKGTILVAEDDVLTTDIINEALAAEYNLVFAGNGQQALEKFNQNLPDIVITDWNMPVMNGLELVMALKNDPNSKHVPIIMMTGYMTESDNMIAAYNAGVIDFIRKPFDIMELRARANSIFLLSVYYKELLERKNRELLLNAMRLAEMNNFVAEMISKIDSISECKDHEIIEHIKRTLNTKILDSTWKQFNEYFIKVHPDFERNLLQKHTELTPAELKLAALLRLNLNTKEISAILHLSPDGIKVSRSRLRKKLYIDNEANLTGYLMQF